MTMNCAGPVCYTANESLALGFDECVRNIANLEFERLKDVGVLRPNASKYAEPGGRCEWIDYDGIRKGTRAGASGAERQQVLSVQMLLVFGFGLLLVGGGIF